MNYTSTRNGAVIVSAAQAIVRGISADGGLFVPQILPYLSLEDIAALSKKDYVGRACTVLGGFLTDFSPDEILACVEGAYGGGKFDNESIAPIAKLDDSRYILELSHGPTCAFKDMALQLLPRLMTTAAKKTGETRQICILVATSGDTGKAALEGFKDVKGTRIIVFYPQNGVSPMQKLQMITQEGANVQVCGIDGNFDDAQTAVKEIFACPEMAKQLAKEGILLSSANSINWGRLVPQIVYYISAYCQLLAEEEIALGDTINVVVPTGNFGNILAAFYAKHMGLPLGKLICASNQNNILTDFINTGEYNRNRPFHTTSSPSMDILISSNLERLLYHLSGDDDFAVKSLMQQLATEGKYQVSPALHKAITDQFWGGHCDDTKTADTIQTVFEKYSYLLDTHTAVAMAVYGDYVAQTEDKTKTIIASTANPYKFSASVLSALQTGKALPPDEFEKAALLEKATQIAPPAPLLGLQKKPVRFADTCKKTELAAYVLGKK